MTQKNVTHEEINEFIDSVKMAYIHISEKDMIQTAFDRVIKMLNKVSEEKEVQRIYMNELILNIMMEIQLLIIEKNPTIITENIWHTTEADETTAEVVDVVNQNNHGRIMLAEEASDYEQD